MKTTADIFQLKESICTREIEIRNTYRIVKLEISFIIMTKLLNYVFHNIVIDTFVVDVSIFVFTFSKIRNFKLFEKERFI